MGETHTPGRRPSWLSLSLALTLCACGGGDDDADAGAPGAGARDDTGAARGDGGSGTQSAQDGDTDGAAEDAGVGSSGALTGSQAILQSADTQALVARFCGLLDDHACVQGQSFPVGRPGDCERGFQTEWEIIAPGGCDEAFLDVIRCTIEHDFSDCTESCGGLGAEPRQECMLRYPVDEHLETLPYCDAEQQAVAECFANRFQTIEGSETACVHSEPGPSQCAIHCGEHLAASDAGAERSPREFSALCSGEGALSCQCMLNGQPLLPTPWADTLPEGDREAAATRFDADDCQAAAQAMADGRCLSLIDCCHTFLDGDAESCTCSPVPEGSSCAERAESHGGEVVDLCPRYAID